jgi:2-amino-1-hydroxyethylphosphonate dioxygenase (glycine-forming)
MSSSPLPDLPLNEQKITEIKTAITGLFKLYGNNDYIGEDVSQLEHALQTAFIAEANGQGPEMILAALFHDIGHLVVYENEDLGIVFEDMRDESLMKLGVKQHEKIGANYLRGLGIEKDIPELVESHVISKRWLCRDPEYHDKLSEASKQTLVLQGGPMTDEEEDQYLSHPKCTDFTSLRLYDDGAKVVGKKTRDLEYYLSFLDRLDAN